MYKKIMALSLVASFTLAGCASLNNEDTGVLAGGVIGGLVGSRFGGGTGQVIATGAGALLGAYFGGNIGKTMDSQDQMRMQKVLETSKTGQVVRWTNPDSGNKYVVQPTKTFYNQNRPCRKFSTTAYIAGKKEAIYGKACRDSSGKWQMIK